MANSRPNANAAVWLLAAVPVFCVVSYPGVALARLSFWAGVCNLVLVAGYLTAIALVGSHTTKPDDATSWHSPSLALLGAGVADALAALAADGANGWAAAACGLVTAAEMLFVWLFLPWLASDAMTGPALAWHARPRRTLLRLGATSTQLQTQLQQRTRKLPLVPRSGLGFLLVFGFLMLGLGATWARAESWTPGPISWLTALLLSSLALMAGERLLFFSRSARDGNLVIAPHAQPRWAAAAFLLACLAGLLAAIPPWRAPSPLPSEGRPGSAFEEVGAALDGVRSQIQQITAPVFPSPSGGSGAAGGSPVALLLLWLALLLLLAAVVLIWGFSRSRAAQLILAAAASLLGRLLYLLRRLARAIGRLFAGHPDEEPLGETHIASAIRADPLLDIFDHPDLLARLSAREIAVRTYHLLLNFAEMLGRGRRAAQTPFEYAQTLRRAVPAAEQSLVILTWGYSAAMYGAEDTVLPAATALRESWERVSAALTAGLSPDELDLRKRAYLATRGLEARR